MDIPKIADFFYNITRLDTIVEDAEGQVIEKICTLSYPELLQPLFEAYRRTLSDEVGNLSPGQYRQELMPAFHVYYLLLRSFDNCRAIIGPYVYNDVPADTVSQIVRTYSLPRSAYSECRKFYQTIPRSFRSVLLTATLMLTILQNGVVEGVSSGSKYEFVTVKNAARQYGERQAVRNVPYQYAEEDHIRAAVRGGDTEAALRCLSVGIQRFEYRSDSVSLWYMQHMASVLGTVMRLAAREGGALPQTIHKISEKYFYLIPMCRSEGDVEDLITQMARDYCQAVQYARVDTYSPIVRSAVAYLHNHFREKTTIENVAGSIPCHPTYLCGVFKRETGTTVIHMLNDIRLEHACGLLSDPAYSVAQAGSEAGFESYGSFNALFKKKYGCTCSQWRKSHP